MMMAASYIALMLITPSFLALQHYYSSHIRAAGCLFKATCMQFYGVVKTIIKRKNPGFNWRTGVQTVIMIIQRYKNLHGNFYLHL